jgi:hypothetical protein
LAVSKNTQLEGADTTNAGGRTPEWGIWGRPCGGELVSGDTIIVKQLEDEIACAVVDVLGHGPDAHELAKHIETFLGRRMSADPTATLQLLHTDLRGSRGAVAGIAVFNPATGKVRYVACGNIVARRMGESEVSLHSAEGTLGQSMRSPTEQKLVLQEKDVLLIHTDGIKSRFGMKDYPKICYERAQVIAKTIVEKFGRSYDDATCLAMPGWPRRVRRYCTYVPIWPMTGSLQPGLQPLHHRCAGRCYRSPPAHRLPSICPKSWQARFLC